MKKAPERASTHVSAVDSLLPFQALQWPQPPKQPEQHQRNQIQAQCQAEQQAWDMHPEINQGEPEIAAGDVVASLVPCPLDPGGELWAAESGVELDGSGIGPETGDAGVVHGARKGRDDRDDENASPEGFDGPVDVAQLGVDKSGRRGRG